MRIRIDRIETEAATFERRAKGTRTARVQRGDRAQTLERKRARAVKYIAQGR
jgi:hypothetical protein